MLNSSKSRRSTTEVASSAVAATDQPSELPVLDFNHLSRYTLGDRALEQEVLGLFAEQLPALVGALGAAADNDDHEAWFQSSHALKGSAKAVGAMELAERAARAEQLAGTRPKSTVVEIERAIAKLTDVIGETTRLDDTHPH